MNLNFSNWTVLDYVKVIANAAGAFGVGYAQNGWVGGVVAAVGSVFMLIQSSPGHTSVPN